jgi:prolyl oligopeptidase
MKFYLTFFMISVFSIKSFSQYKYPITKTVDSSSTYWGITYKDPYRWLENLKSEEVENWYKQQADLTNSLLNEISGRDELIAEYKKLDNILPPKISDRYFENGRFFYKKALPGEKVAKLYYKNGTAGQEVLLFDPSDNTEGKVLSIQGIMPSYDGKKIIIWFSEGGSEINTIKVMNVDTKTFLPDTLYPSSFGAISWSFDNKGFTYFIQKTDDKNNPDFTLNTKTRFHILGDDVKNDIDFFSKESYPDLDIESSDIPFARFNDDSKKYVFGDLYSSQSEMHTYYAPLELKNNKYQWKILCKPSDEILRSRIIIDNDVYAICGKNAKKFKLVHTTLLNPDWNKADIIIAEKKDKTLENVVRCRDFLVLSYSNGINHTLFKYNLKTKALSEIQMPMGGITDISCLDNTRNECIISITSWIQPSTEFQFNAETNLFSPSNFNKAPVYPKEYSDLIVEEVEVKGHDGVMIPLSIIYKKGLEKNGKNVCLMEGYGAYGYSMKPYFNKRTLPLAVKYNVIIAIPHVRGGSEKGEEWHKGGFKLTKPNTWKDFNSCAEYLIAKGYTSASKLAGTGTSAGGIMISRAITERPDLYAAAICNVGVSNIMRAEYAPSGHSNVGEFGTVKDSLECRALYEMDGVQHVVNNTKYPAVICVGGWNDPRVPVWQPGKFAAALQNATASNKPALLKVNYDNGHNTEDKDVTFRNFADQFSFVMWQCGHPDFKSKKEL